MKRKERFTARNWNLSSPEGSGIDFSIFVLLLLACRVQFTVISFLSFRWRFLLLFYSSLPRAFSIWI